LEEIQLKKQQILKQGVAPSLNSPTITPSLSAVGTTVNLVGVSLQFSIYEYVLVNLQAIKYVQLVVVQFKNHFGFVHLVSHNKTT
jgi:hypothetical protein